MTQRCGKLTKPGQVLALDSWHTAGNLNSFAGKIVRGKVKESYKMVSKEKGRRVGGWTC